MEKAAIESVASARVKVSEMCEDIRRMQRDNSEQHQLFNEVYDFLAKMPREGEVAALLEKLKVYAVPF
jgi:uncharacterized protein YjgD (DUF1641 family)